MIKARRCRCWIKYRKYELSNKMNKEQAKKKFPSYFANFEMPEWAREQELEVFRACATGKVDRESFLNTYGNRSGVFFPYF